MSRFFKISLLFLILVSFQSCSQEKNKIIGIWNVKTDYYEGTYEIISSENEFHGKIHSYKDDKNTYKGKDRKEDYFLVDATFKDGKYIGGRMYSFDQKYYNVIITMINNNQLEVQMTVDGEPYKEIWNRTSLK